MNNNRSSHNNNNKTTKINSKMNMTRDTVIVQGFSVLPLKLHEDSTALHYLYVKEHSVRDSDPKIKPKDKTLFVLNLPPFCEKEHVQQLFSGCGKIDRVYIHQKPTAGLPPGRSSNFFETDSLVEGYKVAYVVFRRRASVQAAKSLPYHVPLVLSTNEKPLNTGLSRWCSEYKDDVINTAELQTEIDDCMLAFDKKSQKEMETAKEQDGVPDNEGWITVTRHSKNKAAPRTEAHEKAITRKAHKRRKEKELVNFYSFQIRESKREQIATLRKKFEEDKQKIALMKASRKFRPY